MKPDNYPLPWYEKLDRPYWAINYEWCLCKEGWRDKQSHRPMSEVIPWIDEILNEKLFE